MKRINSLRTHKAGVYVAQSNKWGQIVEITSGKILHVGQLKYIRYTFNKRYKLTKVAHDQTTTG
jgi:hypothetical protein